MIKKANSFRVFVKNHKLLHNILIYLYSIYFKKIIFPIQVKTNYKKFRKYYLNSSDKSIQESIVFMNQNGISMIPFKFTLNYNKEFTVYTNDISGYPYVHINENKVFFPKNVSKSQIQSAVRNALIEQDSESPHKYIANNCNITGHTAILIGGSDGIFALEIINSFDHIFLFECDNEWIAPVTLTLKPYENKVTIVNKFVADISKDKQISLDEFFVNYKYPIDFMQNDVEGNAVLILKGSQTILKKNNMNIAIACYHTDSEAKELNDSLQLAGYECGFSDKFVFMWMQKLQKPYIRKAVIYAKKS